MAQIVRVLSYIQDNERSKPNDDCGSVARLRNSWGFSVADGVGRTIPENQLDAVTSSYGAAETFCNRTARTLAVGSKTLHEAFAYANEGICDLNEAAGITSETVDYLGRDYMCCTAIAGTILAHPNRFAYGCIGDCGVFVYDKDFFPVFISENPVGILESFREGWRFLEDRERYLFWRRELRNRASRRMTYGVLTGEPSALAQVKYGYVDLDEGDTVVLFSDGVYPFIFERFFRMQVAGLLKMEATGEEKCMMLRQYLDVATRELAVREVGNLDDDRTLIAFAIE